MESGVVKNDIESSGSAKCVSEDGPAGSTSGLCYELWISRLTLNKHNSRHFSHITMYYSDLSGA